jgi:hypothetical protein
MPRSYLLPGHTLTQQKWKNDARNPPCSSGTDRTPGSSVSATTPFPDSLRAESSLIIFNLHFAKDTSTTRNSFLNLTHCAIDDRVYLVGTDSFAMDPAAFAVPGCEFEAGCKGGAMRQDITLKVKFDLLNMAAVVAMVPHFSNAYLKAERLFVDPETIVTKIGLAEGGLEIRFHACTTASIEDVRTWWVRAWQLRGRISQVSAEEGHVYMNQPAMPAEHSSLTHRMEAWGNGVKLGIGYRPDPKHKTPASSI